MLLQFSSSAEGVGRPWAEGEERVNKVFRCFFVFLCWCCCPLCCAASFASHGAPSKKTTQQLVFIGKNLDRRELEDGFKACMVGGGGGGAQGAQAAAP